MTEEEEEEQAHKGQRIRKSIYRDSSYLLVTWLTEFLAFTMVSRLLYDGDEAYL